MSSERTHLVFQRVSLAKKSPLLSLDLRPELHALVVPERDLADTVARSASGMAQPRRGRVLVGAQAPGKTPKLRANLGSLLPDEPALPARGTVGDYLGHIIALRKSHGVESAAELKGIPLVEHLLHQPAEAMNATDRRRIAFGLALALQRPAVLVLAHPLRDLDADATDLVLSTLADRVASGTIVLCLVPTARAARRLTEHVHYLDPRDKRAEENVRFVVRSERPREVASRLTVSSAVLATEFSEGVLYVDVDSESEGAAAITLAISETQVEVFEVRRSTKTTQELRP